MWRKRSISDVVRNRDHTYHTNGERVTTSGRGPFGALKVEQISRETLGEMAPLELVGALEVGGAVVLSAEAVLQVFLGPETCSVQGSMVRHVSAHAAGTEGQD